jgi:hypothetical protein
LKTIQLQEQHQAQYGEKANAGNDAKSLGLINTRI